ncbi:MAG: PDZ domain-containing protein [Armatimonadetes bacterium]|nr:PDZ domain-containing protein [Armatimonadota bacterium]MDE2206230.1 PDZ domain-containing protein [Armatimonadota bacterium]
MKRLQWLMACVIYAVALPAMMAGAQSGARMPLQAQLDGVRRKVYPALVNITVVYRYYDEGRAHRNPAGGSGVIISPDGYVVTNFHVAGHTTHITCTLSGGATYDARDVADDPLSDLSILKLRTPPHSTLPYARLGDSSKLRVGDFVLAMGNPLMLSSSMTLGIVSNTKRVFTDFTGTEIQDVELDEGEKTGLYTRWIQHDALILPGNSGGPLVNLQGQVVGINELGDSGVGFAIPSNIVRTVFHQILDYGHVKRGWSGITVLPVDKMGRTTGALVSSITPNSPAQAGGIRPGDIIMAVNGQPTTVRFWEQVPVFYQNIATLPAGKRVAIRLLRNGVLQTREITIAPMRPFLGKEREVAADGVSVRSITPAMALERYLPNTNGVIVTGVRPGYPFESAQPPIAADDVIETVNGAHVTTLESFQRLMAATGGKDALIGFRRQDDQMFTVVKPEIPKAQDVSTDLPQAWLGIRTQVLVPEVAARLNLKGHTGFLITEVYPWTEAAKAGLRAGDAVVSLDGSPLTASRLQDSEDLKQAISNLSVGDVAKLGVIRNGVASTIACTLEATPTGASQEKTVRSKEFEFGARELSKLDRIRHHWAENENGLLVTEAINGGWANVAGLHIDDLLLSINGRQVPDAASFNRVMAAILKNKPKVISMFVRRDVETHFVFIQPDWSHLSR